MFKLVFLLIQVASQIGEDVITNRYLEEHMFEGEVN